MAKQISHSDAMVGKHLSAEQQRLREEAGKNKMVTGSNRVQNALRAKRS